MLWNYMSSHTVHFPFPSVNSAFSVPFNHNSPQPWQCPCSLGRPHTERLDGASLSSLQQVFLCARVSQFGPDHPEVAATLNNLGNAHVALGDHRTKKEVLERVLKIEEQHFPEVTATLLNLGNVHGALGDLGRLSQKELLGRALIQSSPQQFLLCLHHRDLVMVPRFPMSFARSVRSNLLVPSPLQIQMHNCTILHSSTSFIKSVQETICEPSCHTQRHESALAASPIAELPSAGLWPQWADCTQPPSSSSRMRTKHIQTTHMDRGSAWHWADWQLSSELKIGLRQL